MGLGKKRLFFSFEWSNFHNKVTQNDFRHNVRERFLSISTAERSGAAKLTG